jgi:hypothetical protein
MNEGAGMLILAPGLLYELVVLPVWLITKGFTPRSTTTAVTSSALATVS